VHNLAEAEARAARNGLRLEVGDVDAGPVWPGVRYASVHLFSGRDQVASMARTYRDDAGKERALQFCSKQVFNRPVR
jgi:hypothetical protein